MPLLENLEELDEKELYEERKKRFENSIMIECRLNDLKDASTNFENRLKCEQQALLYIDNILERRYLAGLVDDK